MAILMALVGLVRPGEWRELSVRLGGESQSKLDRVVLALKAPTWLCTPDKDARKKQNIMLTCGSSAEMQKKWRRRRGIVVHAAGS